MVATLGNTPEQDAPLVAQALFGAPKHQTQGHHVGTADIPQLHPLEIVPQPFDGIELGRLCRQGQPLALSK